MTTERTAPPATADVEREETPPTGFFRRNRVWFLAGFALVLALALAVWASHDDQAYPDPLDPQNPDPDGSQALAQVLEGEGVEVTIVRSADALHDTDVDARTLVLVTGTRQLAPSTVERLRSDTNGADVLLVEPPAHVVEVLQPGVEPAPAADETAGNCDDDRFADLTVIVDSAYRYDTPDGCFPSNGGYLLARGSGATTFFGAGEALTNDQVLRGDNAAVALRLLGEHDRLVWYLPTYDDADDGEAISLWRFAPEWLAPTLWLAGFAGVALILWRGRRLGKLATEPLPVVVRAVETTRSRGRMYRRADDRPYGASAIRAAARRRLATHLRLGRGATESDIVRAVAHHLGRPEQQVSSLIASDAPAPVSDQGLVQLAQELMQLDREVRSG